jgi:predicted peroxiredoxin
MTMLEQKTTKQKYLINCRDGANDVERATVSFIMALSAATNNADTAVFATSDAAILCVKGGTDDLVAPGYEPLADLVEEFVVNGGIIWLCPVCAKAKGISADDLIPGVELAGVPRTMEFMANGAQVLA